MASIIINDVLTIKGHLTLNREKQINDEGEEILINSGILQCHMYFEDIKTIEIPRLKLIGVDVLSESFGSDDYLMTYSFRCEDVDFNGSWHKDVEAFTYLSYEEMKAIEEIMFDDECVILGSVGKELGTSIAKINEKIEQENDGGAENE